MIKMIKKIYILLGFLLFNFTACLPGAISHTEKPMFKFGVSSNPQTIDPADALDSASIAIIDQVSEGLIAYDLFDPELALIPRLATNLGTWNDKATELTFTLRQDVTFHDGTPFNASAVKYTFDRLNYLIEQNISQLTKLYEPLANFYPATPCVINETIVVNTFTVKFILNYGYVPFRSLLCFSGSYIVHPDVPFDRLIELNEILIGTGPYMLENYSEKETHFVAYQNYYRPQPDIQEMLWILYDDSVTLGQAFLAGDVDMMDSFIDPCWDWDWCCDMNNFHVDPPKPSATIYYLGMNNNVINITFRQAISYAIDYEYILLNVMNNQVVRMKSIIPEGILYNDPTVELAQYNLTTARQILVDAGLSQGLTVTSPDLDWNNLAETSPIATFNYSYNIGNRVRGDVGLLIKTNMRNIGIQILLNGLNWSVFLSYLEDDFDKLQLYMYNWRPDYNDPSTYINSLFSNRSSFNSAQVNDPWLQSAMMEALTIIHEIECREVYATIQHYLAEDLMPLVFLYSLSSSAWWSIHLENYPRNAMGITYFYSCRWYPNPTTETSSDTFPSNPLTSISGNIEIIFYSLLCVPIVVISIIRKKCRLNRT